VLLLVSGLTCQPYQDANPYANPWPGGATMAVPHASELPQCTTYMQNFHLHIIGCCCHMA
jgi:hypothetical protein